MDEINWKKELLYSANFKKRQENFLQNGLKSLSDSWLLGILYTRWKKLKGIKERAAPDCSSSFREWNKKVEDADKCQS